MSNRLDTFQDRVAGFNSVLPSKVYGIWGNRASSMPGQIEAVKLDEIPAENVHEAFREGRKKWGVEARSAILVPTKTLPMFQ